MQSSDGTNAEGSRQLRAVAGMLLVLSGLSLAAMIASCSSPSTQGKSVAGLGELIQEKSIHEKSIQEKSLQEKLATHRSVAAHPQSGSQAHRSTPALVVRQPMPDCELAGLEPDTIDADLWVRLKLDYERHCHKQADVLVRRGLGRLVAVQPPAPVEATSGSDSTRDKLGAAEAAVPTAAAPTPSGVGVQDAARAPSVVAPTSTRAVAASSPPLDAKIYRERAIAAYHNGDIPLALIDFDLAIRLDPNFVDAYIDRGIILYRMREPNLAFDDVAKAMRIANSRRNATPPLPKASPLLNKN
jgi:tetratricopeptide (TPR) repeat protein